MERERKQGRIGAKEITRGKDPDVLDNIPVTFKEGSDLNA
jgi:hypothetical protein